MCWGSLEFCGGFGLVIKYLSGAYSKCHHLVEHIFPYNLSSFSNMANQKVELILKYWRLVSGIKFEGFIKENCVFVCLIHK